MVVCLTAIPANLILYGIKWTFYAHALHQSDTNFAAAYLIRHNIYILGVYNKLIF